MGLYVSAYKYKIMLCILFNCLQRQSGLDKDPYQKIDVILHNWPLVMFRL
jgi:hypothetical protein